MSTPSYFNTPDRRAALEAAAQSWLGTPFRNNSAVPGPGGGVSCHRLASELFFATGCLARFEVPRSTAAHLINGPAAAILDYIDQHLAARFAVLDPAIETARTGDLIVMREHRVVKHLGVVLGGGRFIHVLPRLGVIESLLADPTYGERIEALRRPLP